MITTNLDPATQARAEAWLQAPYDEETIGAVRQLFDAGQYTELTDSFYRDLEFGTGGLRGIMGVGTNRMNKYTIGRATQGLANYLIKVYPTEQVKVAISYDSRNNSKAFARLVADVFSANGIRVYLFAELRPTPHLSFAVRHLQCQGGVMLTASHNPKEYNGYKAYWNDGGQLVPPHDKNVINEVYAIADPGEIKFTPVEENIVLLGKELDDAYLDAIAKLTIRPEAVARQSDLKIVFSPIHGTGVTLVPPALARWGFTNVTVVAAQATPDGNFPTVVYPNPEEEEAMSLAVEEGKRIGADVIFATDPDADRVGAAVKNTNGEYQLLNGNQIGSLLVNYVLSAKQAQGDLRPDDYVVKTIVTTNLIAAIAKEYGVTYYDTLTGFKYIGELITLKNGEGRFLVGGEESYGYLVGELVRDKDAVISAVFIAEMAAYYKDQGKTLFEALIDLYVQHGFYKEKLISLTKKGKAGAEEIQAMMDRLRSAPPQVIGGIDVAEIKDYQQSESYNLKTGERAIINLPKSDVLQFITVDGDVVSARPSGTEPKIKFYCSVKQPLSSPSDFERVSRELDGRVDRIMKDIA
ncbi:phospho-sugar mutase [Parapedobacter koreensis]|uniref:Phosphoglucomutase n=1 Tax=Parapedobacter koreensis TaxID=332977 RepID=A0A1H7QA85_9SPHI|nr:phospho-sugar mutase [Parapedobacter koreensis]SEL45020.1 phosphoglucomutase [Parapedobacter koreensis]